MKRLLLLASLLCAVLAAAGCSLFGSDDCDGREGLFIQTDRNSYQVDSEATLKIENCTGNLIFYDGGAGAPDIQLEKRIGSSWENVFDYGGGLYSQLEEIEADDLAEITLPIELRNESVDTVAGTYRFGLDVRDSNKDFLPRKKRRSNTFEITD